MATQSYSAVDPDLYPAGTTTESGGSALSWSAVAGGTVAAIALTLTLLAAVTFGVGTGVWLGWRRIGHDLRHLRSNRKA